MLKNWIAGASLAFALSAIPAVSVISAPSAYASQAQCQEHFLSQPVCAWQGTEYGGEFSWWPASSTGCHSHVKNANLRSFWNLSPYTIRVGGWGTLPSGLGLQFGANEPITGEICWPA